MEKIHEEIYIFIVGRCLNYCSFRDECLMVPVVESVTMQSNVHPELIDWYSLILFITWTSNNQVKPPA
jgi:hypothetical protein